MSAASSARLACSLASSAAMRGISGIGRLGARVLLRRLTRQKPLRCAFDILRNVTTGERSYSTRLMPGNVLIDSHSPAVTW
jgi:hypothetical protein